MDSINKIIRGDRVIWMVFMFFCLISIVEVYSASSALTFHSDYWVPIRRHALFLVTGLGLVLLVHAVKPKYFSIIGICLPIAWLLMLATRRFGKSVNDSYRWIDIAGVHFQPSELAKLSLIILTAFILNKRKNKASDKSFQWILIVTTITCGIILIDNGSTALMLFLVVFLMMFIGQIPLKQIGKLTLYITLAGAFLYGILWFVPSETIGQYLPRAETWAERLKDFGGDINVYNPDFKIDDNNYQVSHANIAISNGRLIGKMPGNSIERDFLPEAHSDFIYAIIIEEMGLIGGLGVLLLYIILFIRAGIIANRSKELFSKLIVIGSALILTMQALTNMAVAVSLIPVTGQTLPLVSRGGTSTLISCIFFGIILSVSRYNNPKGAAREDEIVKELEIEKNESE